MSDDSNSHHSKNDVFQDSHFTIIFGHFLVAALMNPKWLIYFRGFFRSFRRNKMNQY